ncbi:acid protease [Hypoxylon sp. FL1150]|nr:acid protease [Hypoxylon sp. FL1150]
MSFIPQVIFFSLVGLGQATRLFNVTTHGGHTNGNGTTYANATAFYKSPGQVLSIPLKHVARKGVRTPSLAKRYVGSEVLGVYGAAYFAELSIGTGAYQTVDVLLDTGSFELWVNPDCASTTVDELCDTFGRYDPGQSPTAKNLNKNFKIQYGQGNASGDYYQDDIYISGAMVEDQQFGVSTQSSDVWFGILGLGRGEGNGIMDYPSVVDQLATQGYTDSKLFSLDLGGQPGPTSAITGEIVFGGVDTNKYAGNLVKVPTDPSDPHYVVTLTSISLDTPTSNSNSKPGFSDFRTSASALPVPVIVDSGTTLSLLPEPVVSALAAWFPGAEPDGNGGYTVPCALRDDDSRIRFGFRGDGDSDVMMSVKYSDFIWQADTDACVLGAWYTPDIGVWILGDTFLRGAYVTFDQTNNGLYMAEYVRCGEDSNLVPVPAGPDAAANILGSCTAASVAQRPAATPPHDSSATTAAVSSLTTKVDAEYSEVYTPVPLTGTAGTPITTATAGKPAQPAASSAAANGEDCDENGSKIPQQPHSTAVATVTNTVVRHVSYTADGTPTTQLETVQMVSTISRVVANSDVPYTSAPAGLGGTAAAGTAAHATPVLTQKVEMHTTKQPERYTSRLGTGVAHAEQGVASTFPMSPPRYSSETQSQSQSQSQVLSYAMPSVPSQQQQQQIQQGASAGAGVGGAGAAVAYGGMGWGFNTSSSNNNNYGGNNAVPSHGNLNSMGTADVAAPTGGPVGPVVVPAPAPTPAPVVPPRPTATHSGFIIGTSGAADGRHFPSFGTWMMMVVLGSAFALVVC